MRLLNVDRSIYYTNYVNNMVFLIGPYTDRFRNRDNSSRCPQVGTTIPQFCYFFLIILKLLVIFILTSHIKPNLIFFTQK